MNWVAAGIKRGPYILRIAHRNPPPRTIPLFCRVPSTDFTDLLSVSACLFDTMRPKDPQSARHPAHRNPGAQLTDSSRSGWASALPATSTARNVVRLPQPPAEPYEMT